MMALEDTLRSVKSKHILKHGESICYGYFDYPNGARWIARYKNRYFHIIHDGTGNQFFHSHEPEEIDEETAKMLLSKNEEAWKEAEELWGWEPLEEYLEKVI